MKITLTESQFNRIILSESVTSHKFNDGENTISSIGGFVYVNGEPSCIKSSGYAFGVNNLWKNKKGGLTMQLNDPSNNLGSHNVIVIPKEKVSKLFSDIKGKSSEHKLILGGYEVSLKKGDDRVAWCKKQWKP
jgi:hypothetical protein